MQKLTFLKVVDSIALQQALRHPDTGFLNFFKDKKNRYPQFKSKKGSRLSYTTINQQGTVTLLESGIRLPKSGVVRARIHRLPNDEWTLKSATVSMERDGSYYCSVLFEYEINITPLEASLKNTVGLDYKSDGLYVNSEGDTCGSPKYYRKAQKKLAKESRRLARKQKGSKNREKQKLMVANTHRKVVNQRKDFLHKSTEMANQYDLVCVEDLNMLAMSNHAFGNGKATTDNGYGMFLNFLEYKLDEQGKQLIRIDKWYASSQICSVCGHQNPAVKDLSIRRWECPNCYAAHERDFNAAINIRNEGWRIYQEKKAA